MNELKSLPKFVTLEELISNVKKNIKPDCRAFYEEDVPGIQLTVGWSANRGDWDFQTGDNSYSGPVYGDPYWAVVGVYKNTNKKTLAKEIRDQLIESYYASIPR